MYVYVSTYKYKHVFAEYTSELGCTWIMLHMLGMTLLSFLPHHLQIYTYAFVHLRQRTHPCVLSQYMAER